MHVMVVPAQTPELQTSVDVQVSPSLQDEPSGSAAVQLSAASSHDSAQSPSPSGPGQGEPACTVQLPDLHWSAPLQKNPSLHAVPSVARVHADGSPLHVRQGSTVHAALQPSPDTRLPSSHCSPGSTSPSPQARNVQPSSTNASTASPGSCPGTE